MCLSWCYLYMYIMEQSDRKRLEADSQATWHTQHTINELAQHNQELLLKNQYLTKLLEKNDTRLSTCQEQNRLLTTSHDEIVIKNNNLEGNFNLISEQMNNQMARIEVLKHSVDFAEKEADIAKEMLFLQKEKEQPEHSLVPILEQKIQKKNQELFEVKTEFQDRLEEVKRIADAKYQTLQKQFKEAGKNNEKDLKLSYKKSEELQKKMKNEMEGKEKTFVNLIENLTEKLNKLNIVYLHDRKLLAEERRAHQEFKVAV